MPCDCTRHTLVNLAAKPTTQDSGILAVSHDYEYPNSEYGWLNDTEYNVDIGISIQLLDLKTRIVVMSSPPPVTDGKATAEENTREEMRPLCLLKTFGAQQDHHSLLLLISPKSPPQRRSTIQTRGSYVEEIFDVSSNQIASSPPSLGKSYVGEEWLEYVRWDVQTW